MLVLGHPGHELRIHGWLEASRPVVMILTDGSGPGGRSRLSSTTALLCCAGATQGAIYGRFTDAAIYQAVLDADVDLFVGLVDELADALTRDGMASVAGDAVEGYNPTHDICRLLINAAATIAGLRLGRPIANFSFPLAARPDAGALESGDMMIHVDLDDAALERKLQAAHAYRELSGEVEAALTRWGRDIFRREYLREVDATESGRPAEIPPYYERYGEQRVAAGAYQHVIRYQQHVRPLEDVLSRYAAQAGRRVAAGG